MKCSTLLTIAAATIAISTFGCGANQTPAPSNATARSAPASDPPKVPDELKVSEGKLSFKGAGKGVQIYACFKTAGKFAWTGPNPDAVLLDDGGNIILHHYKETGPVWEAADGSKIMGTRKAATAAPAAAQPAIDWLLLSATGTGKYANVNAVQRVDTSGGAAPPADSCDEAHLNNEMRVNYMANYYFYSHP